MKLTRLTNAVFIFAFSLIAFSCNQQKSDWQGSVDEVDEVTVVKNPIEPIYGEDVLKFSEELSIGAAEGEEEYMLYY